MKKCFPKLKIGGPALGWRRDWTDEFLAYQRAAGTEIDFFSWHDYNRRPERVIHGKAYRFRELLDKHGYTKTESILNEWNYVKNWTTDFPYSARAISSAKGGAYAAAYMSLCQDAPVDMLMYYDARTSSMFNGLFDRVRLYPLKAYYAIYAWSRMKDYGTQVKATVPDGKGLYATAVKGKDGKVALFLARYSSDNNVTSDVKVKCKIENVKCKMDGYECC